MPTSRSSGSSYPGNTTRPSGKSRKSYRPMGLSSLANRMATRPEHVIASSSRKSVSLPFQSQHPRTSMVGEIWVCVSPSGSRQQQVSVPGRPLSWISDRNPAPLPWSSGARNRREPSEDDCSVVPTAGGIHPGSGRVAWRYAALVSFPGSRNRDKSHSPGGRNGAPTQRE